MTKEIQKVNNSAINEVNSFIISPRITEKASLQANSNAYTFIVKNNATKLNLIKEIKLKYKVTPLKVNIVNIPRKKVYVRGKWGTTKGYKKAVIFLNKGESINLEN